MKATKRQKKVYDVSRSIALWTEMVGGTQQAETGWLVKMIMARRDREAREEQQRKVKALAS